VDSHKGLQFPDRPEEQSGTPGPSERRVEDSGPGDDSPAEERVEVVKEPPGDEPHDTERG
jgi:hypothetical protein